MGVYGLWKLIEPVGKPIPLESLENKVLAVDVSIWLYQLTKGLQTTGGGAVPNAHVLGLFNRICKLLYYRIKPIFVFDGGAPALKKETLELRRRQKRKAQETSEQLREKLLQNFLKQKAVHEFLGEKASSSTDQRDENDMFALPSIPEENEDADDLSTEDDDTEVSTAKVESLCDYMYGKDVHSIDINSQQFRSLAPDLRHEILSELIETRKQSSWGQFQEMKNDTNFSSYQMERLVKRHNVQRSLDEATKEMGGRMMTLGELEDMFREDGIVTDSLPGQRIAKDSVTKFIYIMGDNKSDKKISQEKSTSVEKNQDPIHSPPSTSGTAQVSKGDVNEEQFRNQSFQIDRNFFIEDHSSDEDDPIMEEDYVDDYAKQLSREENLSQEEILRIIKARQSTIVHEKGESTPAKLDYSQEVNSTTSTLLPSSSMSKGSDILEMSSSPPFESDERIKFNLEKMRPDVAENTETRLPESQLTVLGVNSVHRKKDSQEQSIIFDRVLNENPSVSQSSQRPNVFELRENIIELFSESDSDNDFIEITNQSDETRPGSTEVMMDSNRRPVESESHQMPNESGSSKLFSESDSDNDFIEVTDNSNETRSGSIEISIDPNHCAVEDDIFADIFQAVPVTEQFKTDTNVGVEPSRVPAVVQEEEVKGMGQNQRVPKDYTPKRSVSEIFQKTKTIIRTNTETSPSRPRVPSEIKQSSPLQRPQVNDELLNVQRILYEEELELQSEYGKKERLGSTITQQMIIEAQELLSLFGLPYVIAPMEAEAQCAFLDRASLTEGTITDDSDIWLFGGQNVYKNFFNNQKYVLQFRDLDIQHFFKLSRAQLIQMALLVGSDYTIGIESIGPVTAIEILAYFSNKPNEPETEADIADTLRKFKDWIEKNRNNNSSALSRKVKNIRLAEEFPNMHVIEAYLYPTVDESKESFTWVSPDLDRIRQYMKTKFGWKTSRIDDILLPVMKRLNNRQKQTTLDTFFKVKPHTSIDTGNVSERVIRAINIMKNKVDVDVSALPAKSPRKKKASKTPPTKTPKKPKRQRSTSGASKNLLEAFSPSKLNVSGTSPEKIPQRERSRMLAAKRKMEAAKVLRGRKKKPGVLPPKANSSYLSESSSDSD